MKKIWLFVLSVVLAVTAFGMTTKNTERVFAANASDNYVINVESDADGVESEKFTAVYDENAHKKFQIGTFEKDATVKYSFIGTGVGVYGFKCEAGGSFELSVDGKKVRDVDCSAASDMYNCILGSVNGLENGEHILEIKTTSDDAWVAIDYFAVSVGKGVYNNTRNLAQCGSIITSVPYPTGGGSKDLNIIRNEDIDEIIKNQGAVGGYNSENTQSYDSYDGSGENQFYMGYSYAEELYFSKLVFIEGATYHDGGWFKTAPVVEVKVNNVWTPVEFVSEPKYPEGNTAEGHGYGIFVYTFKTVRATGIRIKGEAGGAAHFVSVAQIEVYGNADTKSFAEGATYKDAVVYSEHEHAYKEISVTQATCETDESRTYSCTLCGQSKIEYVENTALGHDYSEEYTVEKQPTCTEKGYRYRKCTRCDAKIDGEEIEALGHDIIHEQGKAATCTEKGWNEYDRCSRCDYTTYSETEALGHEYENDFGCCDRKCVRCDHVETATAEHEYDDGVIVKQPTVKEEGEKQFTCSVCGQTKTEPIAKLEEQTQSCGNCEKAELNGNIFDEMMCLAALLACVMLALRLRKR